MAFAETKSRCTAIRYEISGSGRQLRRHRAGPRLLNAKRACRPSLVGKTRRNSAHVLDNICDLLRLLSSTILIAATVYFCARTSRTAGSRLRRLSPSSVIAMSSGHGSTLKRSAGSRASYQPLSTLDGDFASRMTGLYGPEVWRRFVEAKAKYDPNRVLSPHLWQYSARDRRVGLRCVFTLPLEKHHVATTSSRSARSAACPGIRRRSGAGTSQETQDHDEERLGVGRSHQSVIPIPARTCSCRCRP